MVSSCEINSLFGIGSSHLIGGIYASNSDFIEGKWQFPMVPSAQLNAISHSSSSTSYQEKWDP